MKKPQLVIPMSGIGARFIKAGFTDPKPLITVLGKPMLAHILEMYKGWASILFIVNDEHLQEESLELNNRLKELAPTAEIFSIPPHKFGPTHAVWEARDFLARDVPILINYCDFAGTFDLQELEEKLRTFNTTLLTYTGFHPHMTRSQKFAYIRRNENEEIEDIQEKSPYTEDPMSEEASAGAYGFQNFEILKDAIQTQRRLGLKLGGEYYTSLTLKAALLNGNNSESVKMRKFYQWGTPEDLQDFNYWIDALENFEINPPANLNGESNLGLILAAGAGKRIQALFDTPKPTIKINGRQLWEYAARSFEKIDQKTMVIQQSHGDYFEHLDNIELLKLPKLTSGQAETALEGLEAVSESHNGPISVLSSDCVLPKLSNNLALKILKEYQADIVVWTAKDYPPSQIDSNNFSWIQALEGYVQSTTHKNNPPETKLENGLITGNFTFRSLDVGINLIKTLLEDESRKINGEFYLDSVIDVALEKDLIIHTFSVTNFFALGTVNEIKTFEYWRESELLEPRLT